MSDEKFDEWTETCKTWVCDACKCIGPASYSYQIPPSCWILLVM